MEGFLPVVVALSGPLAAGKTTLARYLSDAFDFEVLTTRGILELELKALGQPITREALQDLGQRVQMERGELWMTDRMLELVPADRPVALDAIRHVASLRRLREILGDRLHSVHVTALHDQRLERFLKREGGSVSGFESADAHPVEAEVAALELLADVSLSNRRRLLEVTTALGALVQTWMHGRVPVTFELALAAVADFHRKHGFEIGGGTPDTLRGRLPLVLEELGEVARWMTRGEGDLAEEHADLLILILGNAVAMGIDLEDAFIAKLRKIQGRPSRIVHGHKRVSHWSGTDDQQVTTRLDRYRLREPTHTKFREPLPSPQLGLPFDDGVEQN